MVVQYLNTRLKQKDLTAIVDYCNTFNLPYFIDDTFNYAIQNPEQIPFL